MLHGGDKRTVGSDGASRLRGGGGGGGGGWGGVGVLTEGGQTSRLRIALPPIILGLQNKTVSVNRTIKSLVSRKPLRELNALRALLVYPVSEDEKPKFPKQPKPILLRQM